MHLNLNSTLKLIKILTQKGNLTNLHSDLDYNELKHLPKNVEPAFDGLTFNLKDFYL